MRAIAGATRHPLVYRALQAPFAAAKVRPVFEHNDLATVRRVLDIGCGPGTNTAYFPRADYLGIDLSERYVRHARRRHGRRFEVADATVYRPPKGESYDFVFLNSLLHHLDDADVIRVLERASEALTDDGSVNIVDLVLPVARGAALYLARRDRGKFARPIAHWADLFSGIFEQLVAEPFAVGVGGTPLWELIYFKGRRRRAA